MPERINRIAIIGPYPPPFGGISVHIQRVLEILPKDRIEFFNTNKTKIKDAVSFYGKKKYLLVWIFLFRNYKLVHSHSTDPVFRVLLGFIGMIKKNIYVHVHGESLKDITIQHSVLSFLTRKIIRYLNILVVNDPLVKPILKYNPRSIRVIDAFIPPTFNEQKIIKCLNQYREFFQNGRFIVSMNGFFSLYKDTDLYGFDMAADMLVMLRENGKTVFLVACVNGIIEREIYDSFLDKINKNSLNEQILLIFNAKEGWPFFLLSDVFIRPTNTDGLGISILEALWAGTPAIASDCTERPKDTIVFKNRDTSDLVRKVSVIYDTLKISYGQKISNFRPKDFHYALFNDIYDLNIS